MRRGLVMQPEELQQDALSQLVLLFAECSESVNSELNQCANNQSTEDRLVITHLPTCGIMNKNKNDFFYLLTSG